MGRRFAGTHTPSSGTLKLRPPLTWGRRAASVRAWRALPAAAKGGGMGKGGRELAAASSASFLPAVVRRGSKATRQTLHYPQTARRGAHTALRAWFKGRQGSFFLPPNMQEKNMHPPPPRVSFSSRSFTAYGSAPPPSIYYLLREVVPHVVVLPLVLPQLRVLALLLLAGPVWGRSWGR